MTIDEGIKNLEYGTKQFEMEIESGLWIKGSESELCCRKGIALNKQLIEWLTELKELKTADVQPTDRWINAQTNPPIATDGETSDYVLVLRTSGGQCVCYYVYDDDGGNYWCSEDEKSMYDIDEVTYWQPLPEPPKQ